MSDRLEESMSFFPFFSYLGYDFDYHFPQKVTFSTRVALYLYFLLYRKRNWFNSGQPGTARHVMTQPQTLRKVFGR